jgi:hypothetical protein
MNRRPLAPNAGRSSRDDPGWLRFMEALTTGDIALSSPSLLGEIFAAATSLAGGVAAIASILDDDGYVLVTEVFHPDRIQHKDWFALDLSFRSKSGRPMPFQQGRNPRLTTNVHLAVALFGAWRVYKGDPATWGPPSVWFVESTHIHIMDRACPYDQPGYVGPDVPYTWTAPLAFEDSKRLRELCKRYGFGNWLPTPLKPITHLL